MTILYTDNVETQKQNYENQIKLLKDYIKFQKAIISKLLDLDVVSSPENFALLETINYTLQERLDVA